MTEYVGASDAGLCLARVVPQEASASARVRDAMSPAAARRPMQTARRDWYLRRAVGIDLVLVVVAASLVLVTGASPLFWGPWEVLGMIPLWMLLLASNKAYALRYIGVGTEEYRAIGRSGLHLYAVFAAWFLLVDLRPSMVVLVPILIGLPVASALGHKCLRTVHFRQRANGEGLQRVVVVGHASATRDMVNTITTHPATTGLKVVAVCTDEAAAQTVGGFRGVPVHGGPHTALQAAEVYEADVVAIASHPDLVGHSLRRLSWALEARGIDLMVDPGIVEVAGPRLTLRPAAGMSMLHVERPLANPVVYRIKLVTERVAASLALVALVPLFAVLALLIKRDSPGPVFFSQHRAGAGGHPFRMFKFRSMVTDAEARRESFDGEHDGNTVLFKLRDDPRVTRVGTWLRRFSIDELPQLINVARGEMSLIGPRPPLQNEVDAYTSDAHRRLRLRPGMTGLWQVNGRSDLSWEESLRLDLWYVDNWSPIVDLQIVVRTFRAVVRGRGAY